ncbi:uncharacterized protein LOC121732106 [Aricia agestis]|uniref:uncharacterized protein LOC121732106 n=1 Tax=Aricia agestis TaxID=91739 RepID=UPI001C205E1F|nr:uncharacterized protein LOC121732106 [Aricia agestis]
MASVKLDMEQQRDSAYGQRDIAYGQRDSAYGQRDIAYGQRDSGYGQRDRRSRKETEFVYVNQAYDGSTGNLSSRVEPPTTVIREQYWACSRWPAFQKMLVISVAVLFGMVIGLAIWVALANKENPPISDIFQRAHVAPD